jgi:predicted RNA-binding Zn-ribbon protein involved in translation (DUF1610 family)
MNHMKVNQVLLPTSATVWFQICPKCQQMWVIGAAQLNEPYRCKACGRDFKIGHEHQPAQPNPTKAELAKH